MACSKKVIEDQFRRKNVKRDVDVEELYLASCNLTEVENLGHFKNLKQLWLNKNKLTQISCLSNNFRLCELYLHNNDLKDISGALQHLTCLQVLFLHNNQLEKLEHIVQEFRKMKNLNSLNLFNNPAAREPEYRVYVIHHVPSVQLLDRNEVEKSERDIGCRLYDQEAEGTKDHIAFGRRSEGPPSLYYPGHYSELQTTKPAPYEVGNNFYRNNPPYANPEQAVSVRSMRRSVMEYSHFDWAQVPSSDVRRRMTKAFSSPQVITTRFR